MQPQLTITRVSKKYSDHVALSDVSFNVPEGSVFGLLGPNGAGKTSLIRIINQITAPDTGEVRYRNELLQPHHTSVIGYLPEERGLYKKMTVMDQVLYLARLKGLSRQEAKRRMDDWFARFGMDGWRRKKVEELSKGMQQKVQFIVTVIHQPRLLILDEPFSGFDPINAMLIRDEILRLRKEGATVILSTHNMSSVEELCDHIALLNRSRLVLEGRVSDIRKQFRSNTYRIAFRGEVLGFTNALWTSAEIVERFKEDDIHTFTLKAAPSVTGSVLLKTVLPYCEIVSFNELIPGMNEIFIRQVGAGEPVTSTASHTE